MPADPPTWSGSGACPCPLAGDFRKADHDRLIVLEGKVSRLDESIPNRLVAMGDGVIELEGKVNRLDESIPDRLNALVERVTAIDGALRQIQAELPHRVKELDQAIRNLEISAGAAAVRWSVITFVASLLGAGVVTVAVRAITN